MPEAETAAELRKIANLMALRAVADMPKGEAAMLLAMCSFETAETAGLLGISEASVRAHLSQGRKKTHKSDG